MLKPLKRIDGIYQRYWMLKKIYKNPLSEEELEHKIEQKILIDFADLILEKEREWDDPNIDIDEKFQVQIGAMSEEEGKRRYLRKFIDQLKAAHGKSIGIQITATEAALERSIKARKAKTIVREPKKKRKKRTTLEFLKDKLDTKKEQIKEAERRLAIDLKEQTLALAKISKTKRTLAREKREKAKAIARGLDVAQQTKALESSKKRIEELERQLFHSKKVGKREEMLNALTKDIILKQKQKDIESSKHKLKELKSQFGLTDLKRLAARDQYTREKAKREARKELLAISKLPELKFIGELGKLAGKKERQKKKLISPNQIFLP